MERQKWNIKSNILRKKEKNISAKESWRVIVEIENREGGSEQEREI